MAGRASRQWLAPAAGWTKTKSRFEFHEQTRTPGYQPGARACLLFCNSTVRLMSISFLPYVRDDARDLWVIPALARDDGDAFEVSVSNGNAVGCCWRSDFLPSRMEFLPSMRSLAW